MNITRKDIQQLRGTVKDDRILKIIQHFADILKKDPEMLEKGSHSIVISYRI